MTNDGVSVVIPVGPEAHHQQWLDEALESVRSQSLPAQEILLVDDMAGMPMSGDGITIWHAPWRLGVASAFNCGVSLASTECVFMLGADDRLLPECLEACWKSYEGNGRKDDYYSVGVQYSDGREDQYLPCNAAMATKGLWRKTGGFPVESASGAPDAAFVSILLAHKELGKIVHVDSTRPLYWYRVHQRSDTAGRAPWQGVIRETRGLVTTLWQLPTWGRFHP